MSLNRYQGAKTRVEKSQVVHAIVTQLRLSSPTGAFLKMNYVTRKWMTVSDAVAHEKVGHAIRDALSVVNESRMQSQFTQAKHNTREILLAAQDRIFQSLAMCQSSNKPTGGMARYS
jgi:hypothetical protein